MILSKVVSALVVLAILALQGKVAFCYFIDVKVSLKVPYLENT